MQGFQITIMTEQNRRIEHKQAVEWVLHFADQPIEVVMAVTADQSDRLLARINLVDTRLFYIKTPIDFGELGTQAKVR